MIANVRRCLCGKGKFWSYMRKLRGLCTRWNYSSIPGFFVTFSDALSATFGGLFKCKVCSRQLWPNISTTGVSSGLWKQHEPAPSWHHRRDSFHIHYFTRILALNNHNKIHQSRPKSQAQTWGAKNTSYPKFQLIDRCEWDSRYLTLFLLHLISTSVKSLVAIEIGHC